VAETAMPPTSATTATPATAPIVAGATVPQATAAGAAVPPAATAELFEAAVRLHSRRLLAIARAIVGNRASAEDVVQQALVNLYQHRDRYDWNQPGGLMRRSVVNEALRILRQPRMTMVTDDEPDPRGRRRTGRDDSPADPMIDRETVERVRAAIARLPEHFRAALVLCEYEGMAYTQIAEVLGASIPQVKTWLHRGRRQLAEMLKGYVDAGSLKDLRSVRPGPDGSRPPP
jgi:RNA polymerase sigma-70 factor (ECF subfamily)